MMIGAMMAAMLASTPVAASMLAGIPGPAIPNVDTTTTIERWRWMA